VGHAVFDYRCRVEMYDRDVELLQFCAANLEPEQFLVHLLNKFGLVTWASQVKYTLKGLYTEIQKTLY